VTKKKKFYNLDRWREDDIIKQEILGELRIFLSSNQSVLDQKPDPELAGILSLDMCYFQSVLNDLTK
jgi:hypothetical protein